MRHDQLVVLREVERHLLLRGNLRADQFYIVLGRMGVRLFAHQAAETLARGVSVEFWIKRLSAGSGKVALFELEGGIEVYLADASRIPSGKNASRCTWWA